MTVSRVGVSGGGHTMSLTSSSQYSLTLSYRYLRHLMLLLAGEIILWGGVVQTVPLARSELALAVYSLPTPPCRQIAPVLQQGDSPQPSVLPV